MSDSGIPPERINVSRDALRADLAEMELRLKSYIALELDKKAPAAQFERLAAEFGELKRHALVDTGPVAKTVRSLEEGTFSTAQKLVILELIDQAHRAHVKESWSWKDRALTVIGTTIAGVALYFSIIFTIHSTHSVQYVPTPTTTTSINSGAH